MIASTYCVQYYSRTLVAIADRRRQQKLPVPVWEFNFLKKSVQVAVTDSIKTIDTINMHTGLNVFVKIEASSAEEAKTIARDFAETLLTLISFTTMASCGVTKFVSVLDITKSDVIPTRFIAGLSETREILSKTRIINLSEFREVFTAYDKISSSPDLGRVARAKIWLRRGINERNTVDQFLYYWFGIETISCLLRDRLRFKKESPSLWDGIKLILTDKVKFNGFNGIYKARQDIFHGKRELDNIFVGKVASYLEPMRKGLVWAIGDILGLKDDVIIAIVGKPSLKIGDGPWSVLQGKIHGIPSDFESLVKSYPSFELKNVGLHYSLDSEGNPQVKLSPTHTFHCHSGGTFHAERAELWG